MVYEDAEALYANVRKIGNELLEEAFRVLYPKSISFLTSKESEIQGGRIMALNTTPFPRMDVIKVPLSSIEPHASDKDVQMAADSRSAYVVMHSPEAGGASSRALDSSVLMPVSGAVILCIKLRSLSH